MNAVLKELPFTEARSQFSTVFDKVFHEKSPTIISRKGREEVILLAKDMMKEMLRHLQLNTEVYQEENNSVTIAIDDLELVVNQDNFELAMKDLINELKLYAQDYIDNYNIYYHAPNRKSHLPFVTRISLANNDEEIKEILAIKNASDIR